MFEPSGGWDGARSLAGASPEHNQIKHDVETALDLQLRHRDCVIFSSDQRVEFKTKSGYVYPDIVVACDPTYEGVVLKNPELLIEILSEGTAEHNLTRKMEAYALLKTLEKNWFVATSEVRLIQFFRTDHEWGFRASGASISMSNSHYVSSTGGCIEASFGPASAVTEPILACESLW